MNDLIERLNRQHDRVRDPFAIKKESSIFSEAVSIIEQQQQRIENLEQRNTELGVMVERLREEVTTAIEIIEDCGVDYDEIVAAKEKDDE